MFQSAIASAPPPEQRASATQPTQAPPQSLRLSPHALTDDHRDLIRKIYDNPTKGRTATQNLWVYAGLFSNLIIILILVSTFAVHYQLTPTLYTYFVGGTTDCEVFNDLRLHRWLYLALVIVNLPSMFLGLNIGEAFWGAVTFVPCLFALVGNVIIFIILNFYLINLNVDGYGDTGNIAQDYRFCGIAAHISNAANACEKFNPTNLALTPAITAANLKWNTEFLLLYLIMIVIIILGLVMLASNYFTPTSTALLKEGAEVIEKLRAGDYKQLLGLDPAANALKNFGEKAGSFKLDFFTPYTAWQIWFYIPMMTIVILLGVYGAVWFGWFQQNVKTWPYVYVAVTSPSPHAVLTHNIALGNFLFYAFLGVNLLAWCSLAWMLNFRLHKLSFAGSIVGFLANTLILLVLFFVFLTTANRDGFWWNIANDRQRFCAAQTASPFYQWFSNAANRCPNNYACPTQFEPADLELDWDFRVLLGYACTSWVCFLILTIYNTSIYLHLRPWTYTSDEARVKEAQLIVRDMNIEVDVGTEGIKAIGNEIYPETGAEVDDSSSSDDGEEEEDFKEKRRKRKPSKYREIVLE
jgi:hypothetical protein